MTYSLKRESGERKEKFALSIAPDMIGRGSADLTSLEIDKESIMEEIDTVYYEKSKIQHIRA